MRTYIFRIINARFLARIHINASRECHKQYACMQTQGVNGYQLVITCRLSKGVPELRNPLLSYRPMVFLKSKQKQVQCNFVNKLSIYFRQFIFVNNHSHQANLKSDG